MYRKLAIRAGVVRRMRSFLDGRGFIETETPICVCNWTNEEGSRYAPAMMASAAYAGDYTTEDILGRTDADGVTVALALDTIGYRGEELVGARKFGAFVELHIEQGPKLEVAGLSVGIVTGGFEMRGMRISVRRDSACNTYTNEPAS